jgi:hypothetical protein
LLKQVFDNGGKKLGLSIHRASKPWTRSVADSITDPLGVT